SLVTGFARTPAEIAAGLTLIGVFGAIYHPVGIAMLVTNQPRVGRVLGVNGVYGNAGVAFSALIAGALADTLGWRAAFFVPGVAAIVAGAAFALLAHDPGRVAPVGKTAPYRLSREDLVRVFAILTVATACGGV